MKYNGFNKLLLLIVIFVSIYAAIVLSIWFYNFDFIFYIEKPITTDNQIDKIEKFGQFGDYVGGTLNPLFAFFSFLILVFTIQLQKKQLNESAISQKKQLDFIERQNFENTFFNMIDLHNKTLSNLTAKPEIILIPVRGSDYPYGFEYKEELKGRDIMNLLYDHFLEFQNHYEKHSNDINKKTSIIFEHFITKFYFDIEQYFKNLYQILIFIDNSYISNKKFYSDILRAQLSTSEITILFLNSINQNEKLLRLFIKYEFLESAPLNGSLIKFLSLDIENCIKKTKELDKAFPINKLFGDNKFWKEYIYKVSDFMNKMDKLDSIANGN